ncbi:non-specific DNA binding protein Spt2 [Schizosaccharomyces cryophilus OY26]|uniref:Non-specific DNA binding protein Spt2 n=1 Tax=Schizosaccharomyces cryophilus (strain OY26 / ATCC MYA-4695 / CBS 11777 / NBRC 106824 / NRRL Y48691) TaxID=653667 RepID=S9X7Y9_SCHCR|nr:non-specific DNA binding protein Spt2 [Schizosaccharomyces cryophilus OY26]EPY49831.1 non-specific DNA binding protein Spt2 [Schizosaccharomyces cryophilus OY26]
MAGTPSFQKLMALADSQSAQTVTQLEQLKKAQVRAKAIELKEERDRARRAQRERELRIKYEEEQKRLQTKEQKRASENAKRSERPPISADEARVLREQKDKERLEKKKPVSYNELLRQASDSQKLSSVTKDNTKVNTSSALKRSSKTPEKSPTKDPFGVSNRIGATSSNPSTPASLAWLKADSPRPTGPASNLARSSSANAPFSGIRNKVGSRPGELVQLQAGPKRDKRSVAEVQDEIMRKRTGMPNDTKLALKSKTASGVSRSLPKSRSSAGVSKQNIANAADRPAKVPPSVASSSSRASKLKSKNRPRDDFVVSDDEGDGVSDVSSEIWKIFGKRKQDYVSRDALYSDDDDMEATGQDVWREEQAAARAARHEDELEEQRERELEMAKRRKRLSKG